MKTRLNWLMKIVAFLICSLTAALAAMSQNPSNSAAQAQQREDAYRANNIGVAVLEQYNYQDAVGHFRRALTIDPNLFIARVNLAIAFYNMPDLAGAMREADLAIKSLPASPQAHYILGLVARAQNRAEDAISSFRRVLAIDANDVGANVNLAQILMQQRKYPEAVKLLRIAVAAEPYNVTATYNLATSLLRSGEREEGQRLLERFQTLRESNYGTTIGQNYLEQGRYSEAITSTGAEPELVDPAIPDVKFTDATSTMIPSTTGQQSVASTVFGSSVKASDLTGKGKSDLIASLSGAVTLFDFDGDGDLDMLRVGASDQKLYRNDGGKFVDVTENSGLSKTPPDSIGLRAVTGDYDNDTRPDIFVLRYGGNSLYRNDGDGKFSDVTAAATIPAYSHLALSVAFVDVDHDGDLDVFIPGFADLSKLPTGDPNRSLTFPDDFAAAPNMLLRNNGDGKFTDITAATQLANTKGRALAVVPTDYNNLRDIDFLLANYNDAPALLSNLRDGTFRDVAAEAGLDAKARFISVAAGDINKDNFTDFFFGRAAEPGLFALSDGKGRYVASPAPAGTESASAAQIFDYDNDGLLDLAMFTNSGLRVLRNIGNRWADASGAASDFSSPVLPRSIASGDMDGDGDTDLIAYLPSGELKVARNEGGNRNASARVRLTGRIANRSGIGSKIEARAGSLSQKLELYSASPAPAPADVIFGLGKRVSVDAVRVLWPSGNVQAEFEAAQSGAPSVRAHTMNITEIDRKPSSCPYLYAWNGERFEFITDFMGGGEMGYWVAPGQYNHPDPDEYVRIRDDQLKERNGLYEIRVTNELEEALFVDRLQLVVLAHPQDTEVFPNEGLSSAPPPFKLFTTKGARPPLAAVDDHGHDVLSKIERLDRKHPDDFGLRPIRGYAQEHSLMLDLGQTGDGRTLLLLTGWTDYAFSSDNVAAHQSGMQMSPPALQVKDASGQWKTVIQNIGIPVGRPQTLVVDLTGKFLSQSREARLVTNMRVYWDQILVDTSSGDQVVKMTRLDPVSADLRWRGFSAEVSPDGRAPFSYDYHRVSPTSPWKTMSGRYTREGDVRELILKTDDMFVISRPGDEIAISFDAKKLPLLPAGWKRTFLLYADGFSKEMDINSATPHDVKPLPFHGMKRYPYSAPESYPMTAERRRYFELYNTRVITTRVPRIETSFVERAFSPESGNSDGRKR